MSKIVGNSDNQCPTTKQYNDASTSMASINKPLKLYYYGGRRPKVFITFQNP